MLQLKIKNFKFKFVLVFLMTCLLNSCAAYKAKKCGCPTFSTTQKSTILGADINTQQNNKQAQNM
jgi:hypothetical protein